MAFLDPSKGMKGTVPADSPLHAPIWVVSTLRDYVFKSRYKNIKVKPNWLRSQFQSIYKEGIMRVT